MEAGLNSRGEVLELMSSLYHLTWVETVLGAFWSSATAGEANKSSKH